MPALARAFKRVYVHICVYVSVYMFLQGTGGECGLRGGYVEMSNIHQGTIDEMYKCASINLCPNTVGQVRARVYTYKHTCLCT